MLKKMRLIFDFLESNVLTSWSCSWINNVNEWLLTCSIKYFWKYFNEMEFNQKIFELEFSWTTPY